MSVLLAAVCLTAGQAHASTVEFQQADEKVQQLTVLVTKLAARAYKRPARRNDIYGGEEYSDLLVLAEGLIGELAELAQGVEPAEYARVSFQAWQCRDLLQRLPVEIAPA